MANNPMKIWTQPEEPEEQTVAANLGAGSAVNFSL